MIAGGYWSDRIPGSRRTPVIFYMCLLLPGVHRVCCGSFGLVIDAVLFVMLLGVIGFFEMGPDALLAGACAMDVGSRRQAALAAGVINGFGSIGPILQEPMIGWLKENFGLNSVLLLLVIVGIVTTIATWLLMRFERGRV